MWRAVVTVITLFAAGAAAQTYPSKPVRLVVPFPPGGPADVVARPLAQRLTETLGQPVVIDNRAGATGTIGAGYVAKSPPDGYTLLMGTSNELSMSPGLYTKLPYDPNADFAPVSVVIIFPNILVTHPALPVRSTVELIALARARPGQLNFATSGPGSTNHLTGELFKTLAHVGISFVPYKGGAPAVADLMGGHVDALFATMPSAVSYVQGGKLKALMVTDSKRWPAAPAVPDAKEAGLPGLVVVSWNGVLAPAGTPTAIVNRLHADIVKIAGTQDMKERMTAQAAEVLTTSPEEFSAMLRKDFAKWLKVIQEAGVRAD
ncbi:MAG: Bug family tripartite tricarboxylate transporter substrate binding protein [Burkholderiales bacterium]